MKNKSDGKIFLSITLVAFIFSVALATTSVIHDIHRHHTWQAERQIIEITIEPGDTLYSYAEKYAPTWMDTRDYCQAVKDLNDMTTSNLQAFQNLKLYI